LHNLYWIFWNGSGFALVILGVGILEYFIQIYKKTRYLVTEIGIIILLLFLLLPQDTGTFLTNSYFVLLFVFVIMIFREWIRRSSGNVRKNLFLFGIFFFIVMLGNAMTNETITTNLYNLGYDIISIGIIAQIIKGTSYFLMAVVLFRLPLFFEVQWETSLLDIIIIFKDSGLPLASMNLKSVSSPTPTSIPTEEIKLPSNSELPDELIASGMSGITMMLREISKSKENLQLIDHGDIKIMLEYGTYILIALSVKEELRIYRDKLIHLRSTIEELFAKALVDWNGDLEKFSPIETLIKNEFQKSS
jgi:hypothetical protein